MAIKLINNCDCKLKYFKYNNYADIKYCRFEKIF